MKECKTLLRIYDVEDEPNKFTKFTWKRQVKEAVKKVAAENILNNMKKYIKVDYKKKCEETFQLKEYLKNMNLQRARMKFSISNSII